MVSVDTDEANNKPKSFILDSQVQIIVVSSPIFQTKNNPHRNLYQTCNWSIVAPGDFPNWVGLKHVFFQRSIVMSLPSY